MPIPFRNEETIEELGTVAFLYMELAGETLLGGLLFLNSRGEPLEFVFNRLELLSEVLWRPSDRLSAGKRRLATTLFQAATLSPGFLLARAEDTARVFGRDGQITLAIPLGNIGPADAISDKTAFEVPDAEGEAQRVRIIWTPQAPIGAAGKLFSLLVERGLILEPFSRAAAGLREVYGAHLQETDKPENSGNSD